MSEDSQSLEVVPTQVWVGAFLGQGALGGQAVVPHDRVEAVLCCQEGVVRVKEVACEEVAYSAV